MTTNPRNMADLMDTISAVRSAARAQATLDRESGDLTSEGLRKAHAGWTRERQWSEKIDAAQARATKVVEGRRAKVDQLREKVTAPPADVNARMLSELIFSRRRSVVESILAKPGMDGLADYITSASPDELPTLVSHLRDVAAAGHPFADTLTATVNEAVDALNPEIATAAESLTAAEQAAEHVRIQADDARAVLADVTHSTPTHVQTWTSGTALESCADISL